jgi:TRAP-type mannitol/chloroaromatic compound transport system permease small subunit
MQRFLFRLSNLIDSINERVGSNLYWLCLLLVIVSVYNSVMRYVGKFFSVSLTTNGMIEIQWYLFSILFLLGAAYCMKNNVHIRVDVFYEKFSEKKKSLVEIFGHIFLLIPFCILSICSSIPAIQNSWRVLEKSPDPGGLIRYPIKTLLPIAFFLLLLQSVSSIIKNYYSLTRPRQQI